VGGGERNMHKKERNKEGGSEGVKKEEGKPIQTPGANGSISFELSS